MSSSMRFPTHEQLVIILGHARRYLAMRQLRRDALTPGDLAASASKVSKAGVGLKKALDESDAGCPYGWHEPVSDALQTLVHDVARELAPGPSAVAGRRPTLYDPPPRLTPWGYDFRTSIPGRPAPIGPPRPIPRPVEDLSALEVAVEALESAVAGEPDDAPRVAVSPSPIEAGPEPTATPKTEPGDDEEVWGRWIPMSIVGLVEAMGDRSGDSAHAVITRMETAGTIQMRPAVAPVGGGREWEFRIKDPALRERVLKYIAEDEQDRPLAKARQKRLVAHLDYDPPFLTLDGEPLPPCDEVAIHYIAKLIELDGGRKSFQEFVDENPAFVGSVVTRVLGKLPPCIARFIERKGPGSSPRLKVEDLQ
jgi:hypothetical protein